MDELLTFIRGTKAVGNALGDRALWKACHEIAADAKRPMAERLEALAKMNELTGENDPVTEEALAEYLLDTQ